MKLLPLSGSLFVVSLIACAAPSSPEATDVAASADHVGSGGYVVSITRTVAAPAPFAAAAASPIGQLATTVAANETVGATLRPARTPEPGDTCVIDLFDHADGRFVEVEKCASQTIVRVFEHEADWSPVRAYLASKDTNKVHYYVVRGPTVGTSHHREMVHFEYDNNNDGKLDEVGEPVTTPPDGFDMGGFVPTELNWFTQLDTDHDGKVDQQILRGMFRCNAAGCEN